jgi:hypothetical protein
VGLLFLHYSRPLEHPGSDSESIGDVFAFVSHFLVALWQNLAKSWHMWLVVGRALKAARDLPETLPA